MEARKMVLINLFAGQEQSDRRTELTYDTAGEGEGKTNLRESY